MKSINCTLGSRKSFVNLCFSRNEYIDLFNYSRPDTVKLISNRINIQVKKFFFFSKYFERFNVKVVSESLSVTTKLAHDFLKTLFFGCLLVATSGNVEATLPQRCLSLVVAPTKIYHCYNVVFSTLIFRPDANVVATSCF